MRKNDKAVLVDKFATANEFWDALQAFILKFSVYLHLKLNLFLRVLIIRDGDFHCYFIKSWFSILSLEHIWCPKTSPVYLFLLSVYLLLKLYIRFLWLQNMLVASFAKFRSFPKVLLLMSQLFIWALSVEMVVILWVIIYLHIFLDNVFLLFHLVLNFICIKIISQQI
jgi:hypothetical protein